MVKAWRSKSSMQTMQTRVEFTGEDIDRSQWIFIDDEVVQAPRQQRNLRPSLTLDGSFHDYPHDHDDRKG